jgi:hypothetical protein
MGGFSWEDLPVEFKEDAVGESRTIDQGGMTVAFERWKAGVDTTPLFKGLPDDSCQAPHWGYVVKGSFRVKTRDGEETIRAGQAYYLAPGHIPVVDEDVELIEFTDIEARRATMEHATKQLQAQG